MVGTLPRVRRRALPVAILAAALLAGGCAARSSSGDADAPAFRGQQQLAAEAVEDLQDAATKGDEARICRELLAEALAERLGGTGQKCERTVQDALEDTDSSDLSVRAVRVTGATATARVKTERGDKDKVTTVGLAREGGRWRISRLG
jgi:hypothetical protein